MRRDCKTLSNGQVSAGAHIHVNEESLDLGIFGSCLAFHHRYLATSLNGRIDRWHCVDTALIIVYNCHFSSALEVGAAQDQSCNDADWHFGVPTILSSLLPHCYMRDPPYL